MGILQFHDSAVLTPSSDIPQGTITCHLEHEHADRYAVLAALEVVKTYFQDLVECQQLKRCKVCGQLYFCDFQDVTRYFDHDGMRDHVLIPVENVAVADLLFAEPLSQRAALPALVLTWPPEDGNSYWVNR
jgi:hypothetical protein